MIYKELQAKSDAELTKELERLNVLIKELTLKKKLGQLKQLQQASVARKDFARIKTLLHERITNQ